MTETAIALIDCNSFYCSCERVFRPDLNGKPIVVLSNNDGCIISRSEEAKKLNIAMGAPYFQVREQLRRQQVATFSSNYALYGDMSARVMQVIESLVPRVEVYSIDEAFADLSGLPEPLQQLGEQLKQNVLRSTGIPVSVGIAPTKTLAKLANYAAKRWQERTGGVLDIRPQPLREKVLRKLPVHCVWGIGPRLAPQLLGLGIRTAWDLAQSDRQMLRKRFGVVVEKTAAELAGIGCLQMDEPASARQSICCSRMFNRPQSSLKALQEAVASYTHQAASRLRAQGSLCRQLQLNLRTRQMDGRRGGLSATSPLPYPSNDVRELCDTAQQLLQAIYRQDQSYSKAEVLLLDLCQPGEFSDDLFKPRQSNASQKTMQVLDQINARWGRDTLRPARVPQQAEWSMRREMKSPSYTTRFDQLWTVKAE